MSVAFQHFFRFLANFLAQRFRRKDKGICPQSQYPGRDFLQLPDAQRDQHAVRMLGHLFYIKGLCFQHLIGYRWLDEQADFLHQIFRVQAFQLR